MALIGQAAGRMPKRVRDEQSPSGWSEVPWHTCCDPVTLAAPYVIDLHHDTVARDQLAHLAEVLHEYLEKSPGVVDSAWVRQHLWRRMGISFLLTREYKHLAPPCLHGEFQSDKRRQLVTYGKPLPAEHPLATIPPGDSEPALTEPTSPEATEHATDEPAALGIAPSETDNSVDPSRLAVTATPCPDNLWSQLHANKHIKLASFAPTSWFDADQLESEKQTVRTGEDPDGNVDRDVHRRMHTLPQSFSTILGGFMMQGLRATNLGLGNRDQIDMRLFISTPGGLPGRVHCDNNPFETVYCAEEFNDDALLSGLLALEPGTELLFYPDGPSKPALTMRLEPGDVLLFRGDCWHAGAGYTTKNRRIHFYLSSPMRRREAGRTWFYAP